MGVLLDAPYVRRELALRGLTQREFAELAGLPEKTVSWALNGHRVALSTVRTINRTLQSTERVIPDELLEAAAQ